MALIGLVLTLPTPVAALAILRWPVAHKRGARHAALASSLRRRGGQREDKEAVTDKALPTELAEPVN